MISSEFLNTTKFELFFSSYVLSQIRIVFKKEWQRYTGEVWQDGKPSLLLIEFGRRASTNFRDQKMLLKEGDTSKWDISMFVLVFRTAPFFRSHYVPFIEEIARVRNSLAHRPIWVITDYELTQIWNNIIIAMKGLGMKEEDNTARKIETIRASLKRNMSQ